MSLSSPEIKLGTAPAPVILPIILCGGAGTRLWPVSREALPKPFISVGGATLLARTWERGWAVPGATHAALITNVAYSYKIAEEVSNSDASAGRQRPGTLLLEPFGRNTAPALALAALWATEKFGADVVLLVLPADHLIDDLAAFSSAVGTAAALARNTGRLMTFGITPTYPDTGFGYIETGAAIPGAPACEVLRFVEKPELAKAKEYLAAGNFLWNSGMFCFTAGGLIEAMKQHSGPLIALAEAAYVAATRDPGELRFDPSTFAHLPDISIDYAVMEKAGNVGVVPCNFFWSDIGSWKAVSEAQAVQPDARPDADGNVNVGDAIFVNARGTYVHSSDRVVAAVGVEDLVVVDTPDAVLVAHKNASQDVKEVVRRLKEQGSDAYKLHRTVHRPWGTYTILHEAPGFKVKRIEVKPGAALSLQLHRRRSEHWVVVSGVAEVTVGESVAEVLRNQSRYVPVGDKHRLANHGTEPVVMVEVQCGTYLGEDDIERFEDRYGRG